MIRFFPILLMLCFQSLTFNTSSRASDGTLAEEFIRSLSTKTLELVTDNNLEPSIRQKQFSSLLDQGFDMPWIGQFVLGRNWNALTPEQRADYLHLFQEIIAITYSKRFVDYSGHKIEVTGHRFSKKKYIFVKSKIYNPKNHTVSINVTWRLLPKNLSFKILDVVIEGVSMAVTQRNEYATVIQRNNGDVSALIQAMRQTLSRLKNTN